MVDRAQQLNEARQTVARMKGYWYRAGVPRAVSRRKAEELLDHLVSAVGEGRLVRDVVGSDLAGFASEWAQADRKRPVFEPVLWAVGAVAATVGLLSLSGPIAFGHDHTGFDRQSALQMGSLMLFFLALQLLRWQRHKLTIQQATLVGIGIFVTYVVVAANLIANIGAGQPEVFIAISAPLAWSLLGIAGVAQALLAWAKRTNRF